jgi:hypothetical protein
LRSSLQLQSQWKNLVGRRAEATATFDIPGTARIRTGARSPAQSVVHLRGKGEGAAGE